jgi:hypothetical protein
VSAYWPNEPHQDADKEARLRAISTLRTLRAHADILTRRLESGTDVSGTDADWFARSVLELAKQLTILETLRLVRRWHEVDQLGLELELRAAAAEAGLPPDLNLPPADRQADLAPRMAEYEAEHS